MDNISREDFRKKYDGTVFKIAVKNKPMPEIYRSGDTFYDDNSNLVVMVHPMRSDGKFKDGTPVLLSDLHIYPAPESKIFDANGEVWYYTKNGSRQWRVGFCSGNSVIYNLLQPFLRESIRSDLMKAGGDKQFSLVREPANINRDYYLTLPFVSGIFSDDKPCVRLDEAIKQLGEHCLSKVLYGTFWITLSPNSNDEYFIFSLGVMVARVVKKEVQIINKRYRQEVLDYLKRSHTDGFNVI